jgi:fermentation-respiration switch protein FrsA (DUF1100 family)
MFALGQSMGAAILLQTLPDLTAEEPLCAAVAEAPFASFREVAYDRLTQPFTRSPDSSAWLGRILFRPVAEFALGYVQLRYAVDLAAARPERALAGTMVPGLLIRGDADANIPARHAEILLSQAGENVSVWRVAGAEHAAANASPEFESRVVEWFRGASKTPR